MKKLFLIDGAAGTGKSDLLEYIETKKNTNSKALNKFTTRAKRDKEEAIKTDLKFITSEEFEKMRSNSKDGEEYFYYYRYGEPAEYYGFYKKDLIDAIEYYENTFIIIRNKDLIKIIEIDFNKKAVIIPIHIYTDRNLIVNRLKREGYTKSEIKFRLRRAEAAWGDFIESDELYKRVIINNSSLNDYHRQINQLVEKYTKEKEHQNYLYLEPNKKYELIKSLVGHKQEILEKLNTYPYEKNIFLMMKFRNSNNDAYLFMKELIEKNGYNCVRADQNEWKITDDVYNPLAVLYCCKYGIALFDESENGVQYNPNVSYELGIMHYQKKECLILKYKDLTTKPFDLIKDLHVEYSNEIQWKKILEDWLLNIS